MNIRRIADDADKKCLLDLLLLADEQEDMIDRYLSRGDVFILEEEGTARAQCVVTAEGTGIYELKNIAVYPQYQGRGYARALIEFIFDYYTDCVTLYVGTGDSPLSIPFYEKCGFKKSHIVKNFFIEHYNHPMHEDGKQLVDMIYLRRDRQYGSE